MPPAPYEYLDKVLFSRIETLTIVTTSDNNIYLRSPVDFQSVIFNAPCGEYRSLTIVTFTEKNTGRLEQQEAHHIYQRIQTGFISR